MVAARIRALREAASLTQAQLAGGDFSKGFISLLETARTGLSLRAARILGSRLGVSVDDLMRPERSRHERDLEILAVRAEAELAAGRHEDALVTAKPLARAPGHLRARYLRLQGRALLEADRAREAAAPLDEALHLFRQQGERELAARALFDLGRAHARSEAHGEAAHYWLQCENAIAAGELVDASLEMVLLVSLAGVFLALGDQASADLRMERARRLAEDVAEPGGVASLYLELAIRRQEEGDHEAALTYARRALDAYEHLGAASSIGNVWNTIGWIHSKRGQPKKAEEAFDRADRIARDTGDGRLASYVLQSRAELALARGQAGEAVRLAQASIDHPQAARRARAISLLVKAEALAGTDATAREIDSAFEAAAKALAPFGRGLVAAAHRAHFEALMARGKAAKANQAAEAAFAALPPFGV